MKSTETEIKTQWAKRFEHTVYFTKEETWMANKQ